MFPDLLEQPRWLTRREPRGPGAGAALPLPAMPLFSRHAL